MENFINKVCSRLLCREPIVTKLYELIGNSEEALPNAIYFYGHTGTGKTNIINTYFKVCKKFNYIHINCVECYTSKILYETIINKFYNHKICYENNFTSYSKCENLSEFIILLRKLDIIKSYIICLDNAEKLRDMDFNILPSFLRLQEFTNLNICTILISQLPFEKFYTTTGFSEIHLLHCPQYTKSEIHKILLKNFDNVKEYVKSRLLQKYQDPDEILHKVTIIENLNNDVYDNYLNIFLNMFYRVCRDLPELRVISKDYFEIYCEPIINETIDCNDVSKLWRNISKPLRTALSGIYMRIDQDLRVQKILKSHAVCIKYTYLYFLNFRLTNYNLNQIIVLKN